MGYKAVLLKAGPFGPLNTRRLTVVSMVYRLWAGARLEEVILWHEIWARLVEFGFRPARGLLDAAVVAPVLLKLSGFNGWTVSWMSIDYKKLFNLIPQAIVLRVAAHLGLDARVMALGATYRASEMRLQGRWGRGLWVASQQRHPAGASPVGHRHQRLHVGVEGEDPLRGPTGGDTNPAAATGASARDAGGGRNAGACGNPPAVGLLRWAAPMIPGP